ncbi:DMT family transporter [Paracoccus cavernae]
MSTRMTIAGDKTGAKPADAGQAGAPPAANRPMTGKEWLMLSALAVLWGCSFLFNALAVRDMPVLSVVFIRVALAAVVLIAVLRLAREHLPRDPAIWRALFVMGFANSALPFSLIVWGQTHVAAGVASILNATTPLFTVLFAHVLTTDEKLDRGRVMGVILGFMGVAVMIGGDALRAIGTGLGAQMLFLAAASSYAFSGIYGRRFRKLGVSPMATATGQLIAASVLLLPLVLIVDRPWSGTMPGLPAIGAMIGLAVFSTALAYVLYFRILATAGATNLALVTFLIPICAILLGIVVLGEHLALRHVVGMVLIGGGLAAIDGRLWRRLAGRGQG